MDASCKRALIRNCAMLRGPSKARPVHGIIFARIMIRSKVLTFGMRAWDRNQPPSNMSKCFSDELDGLCKARAGI